MDEAGNVDLDVAQRFAPRQLGKGHDGQDSGDYLPEGDAGAWFVGERRAKGAVQALKRTANVAKVADKENELAAEIRSALMGITAAVWPTLVVNFPGETLT